MREHDPSRRPFWHLRRRPGRVASDVDEELRVHLEMRAEELRAAGMSPEARRAAKRSGGSAISNARGGIAGSNRPERRSACNAR